MGQGPHCCPGASAGADENPYPLPAPNFGNYWSAPREPLGQDSTPGPPDTQTHSPSHTLDVTEEERLMEI